MKPIIKSLLDNDLYKFTMLQAFWFYEKNTTSCYEFYCRTPDVSFEGFIGEFEVQVEHLCSLKFSNDELRYLAELPYIRSDFLDFLKSFKLKKKNVHYYIDESNQLKITIKGLIIESSIFEVHLMSIINQLYFDKKVDHKRRVFKTGLNNLKKKLDMLSKYGEIINFTDFGTRRRFSFDWHGKVIESILDSGYSGFCGTSNVYYAKRYNIKPIGTMAHEWIMSHAGTFTIEESTPVALNRWLDFYKGELGIALTDTYTTDYFLEQFNSNLSHSYRGLRQDSGSWKEWGYKALDHYLKLGIDPATKTFVFSDGLDFETIIDIHKEFSNKVNLLFGIGTNLTNDVGVKPIQIVIKMTRCNGKPVIKISDTSGKIICEDDTLKKYAFNMLKCH